VQESESPSSIALVSGHVLVGNVSNVAADVAMSGDTTIDNTGAVTIGAGKITVAKAASALVAEATVNLTAAQIKALHATPIQLVAAPGSGKYVVVDEIRWKMTFVTTRYTGANNAEFRYTDGSGAKVSADLASATIDDTASNLRVIKGLVTELTPVDNAAVVIAVPVADPAAGDGTAQIVVRYHVVTY